MAKEEPEDEDGLYIMVEPGQYLKAGDEVLLSDGRWQAMSPTVDGFTLTLGLRVRRKVSASRRQHYIFLEPGDIYQDGDEFAQLWDKRKREWRKVLPQFFGVTHSDTDGPFVRRKVVCNG